MNATVPIVCSLCVGQKVVFQSLVGQHVRADFRPYELITLLSSGQLKEITCPQCSGTGTISMAV